MITRRTALRALASVAAGALAPLDQLAWHVAHDFRKPNPLRKEDIEDLVGLTLKNLRSSRYCEYAASSQRSRRRGGPDGQGLGSELH